MRKLIILLTALFLLWGCEKETTDEEIKKETEIVDEIGSDDQEEENSVDDQEQEDDTEQVSVIDKNTTTIFSYSPETHTVTLKGYDGKIDTNSVLVIDLDTTGVIRRVVDVRHNGDQHICETEQASMEDIFVDAEFKLSTSMIEPTRSLKSLSTYDEISDALTDSKGFIHPVEVIYHTREGIHVRSADDGVGGKIVNNLYARFDFTGKRIYQDNNIDFYISEGYFELNPEFFFEFRYVPPQVDWEKLKIRKGQLKKFRFWTDRAKMDFKTMLTCKVEQKYKDNQKAKVLLKDVIDNTTFKFFIAGIPVYVSVDCDIYGNYDFDYSSKVEFTTGLQATRYISAGIRYENGSWSYEKNHETENQFFTPELTGEVNMSQRLEIYPHFDVKIYDVLGPTLDLIPYLYNENHIETSGDWHAKMDIGQNLRIGTNIEIFSYEVISYQSDNINLFSKTIWEDSGTISPDETDNYVMVGNDRYPLNLGYKLYGGQEDGYYVNTFAFSTEATFKEIEYEDGYKDLVPEGNGFYTHFVTGYKDHLSLPGTYFVGSYLEENHDRVVGYETFYTTDFNNEYADGALYTSGEITIDENGDQYTISFDCIDENGVKVKGYYKGILEKIDYTQYSDQWEE